MPPTYSCCCCWVGRCHAPTKASILCHVTGSREQHWCEHVHSCDCKTTDCLHLQQPAASYSCPIPSPSCPMPDPSCHVHRLPGPTSRAWIASQHTTACKPPPDHKHTCLAILLQASCILQAGAASQAPTTAALDRVLARLESEARGVSRVSASTRAEAARPAATAPARSAEVAASE